jgi:hypothetical protein
MFRDELDMLQCRLETLAPYDVTTVLVEADCTHRGVPKPLHYAENRDRFTPWNHKVISTVAELTQSEPWAREHAQRNAAWPVINAMAADDDVVLICDLDEIPSPGLLKWDGKPPVISVRMRTFLFAVDWEVPQEHLPPQCVAATVAYLRSQAQHGRGLAEVRDNRDAYPVALNGGWHFSWCGGPERQREKLETATCHTELLGTVEGGLIASGERYRTSQDGGGLPVVPVDVDETWPAYVAERRCPSEWYRPRA